MNLRIVIKERLGYKGDVRTANLVVATFGSTNIVVGYIKFLKTGKKPVVLYLTSNLHGETIAIKHYETVADALMGADEYLSETEVA
ncbi:MAG: hypothetical protein E6Q97_15705 [Desulfurellales bacterium]|nr:MAG: hypothetical protein E6Q97_15705 [Desulfurellales bacterium]